MNEYLEYLEGKSVRLNFVPSIHQIILINLACDPALDFIMKLHSSFDKLKDFQQFAKGSATDEQFKWRLAGSLQNFRPPLTIVPKFLSCAKQISNTPLKTTKELLEYVDDPTEIGFYACLILAYCHESGLGVTKSEENVCKYLEKAILVSNQFKSDKTAIFLTEEFLEDFTLKKNSKKILCYRIKLLELERKGITISKHLRDHAKNMACLNEFFSPALTVLDPNDPDYEQQNSKMYEFLELSKKKRIEYKIAYYIKRTEELTKYSLNQEEYFSHYKTLIEDTDLKDFSGDLLPKLFDALDKLSDTKFQLRDYENATRFYILLFNLNKSPEVAMKLGEMAANGHLVSINEYDGKVKQEKTNSDFIKAQYYYKLAIDLSIEVLDFTTTDKAILAYKEIQPNIAKSDQLDLNWIVKNAINYFKELSRFLAVEPSSSSEPFLLPNNRALQARIYKVKKLSQERSATTSSTYFTYLLGDLLSIILKNLIALAYLSELRNIYLSHSPTLPLLWLGGLCYALPANSLQKPAYQNILYSSLDEITGKIQNISANRSDSVYSSECVKLINMESLLESIFKYNIHLMDAPSVNNFFEVLNIHLVDRIQKEITSGSVEGLKALKDFYDKIKIPSGGKNAFVNRTNEISYWIERNSFEKTFKEGKKTTTGQGVLFNIYALSASKKAHETFTRLYGSFIYRLQKVRHREAFLKAAELTILDSDAHAELTPGETAVNIIKAMSCQQPVDNLGIYTQFALERMNALKDKVADEKKYNDQHRTTVKFYYGLTLLITDLKKYKNDVSLFEGIQFNNLIPIIFGLFNDPILSFSNDVKREVLTKIQMLGTQSLINKKLQLDAAALCAKLPPPTISVETTATPAPAAAALTTSSQVYVVDPFYATSPINVPLYQGTVPTSPEVFRVGEEVPPPTFSSPPDETESAARLKSELDSLKLLYQQSLNAVAQKDALLQQKDVALEAAKTDLVKAQKEIDRLNRRAARFLDLRSKFAAKQKALVAELETPIDGEEEGSNLLITF